MNQFIYSCYNMLPSEFKEAIYQMLLRMDHNVSVKAPKEAFNFKTALDAWKQNPETGKKEYTDSDFSIALYEAGVDVSIESIKKMKNPNAPHSYKSYTEFIRIALDKHDIDLTKYITPAFQEYAQTAQNLDLSTKDERVIRMYSQLSQNNQNAVAVLIIELWKTKYAPEAFDTESIYQELMEQ